MSISYKYKGFTYRSIYYFITGERRYKLLLPFDRVLWFDTLPLLHRFVDELIERFHLCGF